MSTTLPASRCGGFAQSLVSVNDLPQAPETGNDIGIRTLAQLESRHDQDR